MDTFARVRLEDAENVSRLLRCSGIVHSLYPFEGDYNEWVTFHLNGRNDKLAFERICNEHGITTQDSMVVQRMLDNILEGHNPSVVLEKAVITHGMAKVLGNTRLKYRCKNCDLGVPMYRGAYPKRCPSCSGELSVQG